MSRSERPPGASLRALAAVYLPLLAVATWAVVARLAGKRLPAWVVAAAAAWVALSAVVAAACAAHAILRRRWWWAVAVLAVWPLTVPVYLWNLRRAT